MMRSSSTGGAPDCRDAPGGRLPIVAFLLAAAVAVASAPAAAPAQSAAGTLSGVVRDSGGSGLAGAELELVGRARRERSDARGRFRFTAVPAGAARLAVRRLGYRPAATEARVAADSESVVAIELAPAAQNLAPVVVRERHQVYDARLEGFYARQERGVGYFVGRARIAQASSSSFTDILRAEVPGVRIGLLGNMTKAVRLRGSRCAPLVFLDGIPASAGEFDVDMLELGSLEGIEVYNGLVSVPPEFMAPGMHERCGVIAVWTRPTEARQRQPRRPGGSQEGGDAHALEQLVARGEVFTAADVDVRARLDSASFAPDYPDSLWRAGVGGRVMAEFVVDSGGLVEPGSIRIVASSDARLDGSVRAALLEASFVPARRGARPVRQLVQFPVVFEPAGVLPAATGQADPPADRMSRPASG